MVPVILLIPPHLSRSISLHVCACLTDTLQVGDASGVQSPLSFGGFGSLTRHIERVVGAVSEALEYELLDSVRLNKINAYQPNLSVGWMFQRAMSVRVGEDPRPKVVLDTLANSFSAMERLGDDVMRPFLQVSSISAPY